MQKLFEKQDIESLHDRNSGKMIQGYSFTKCSFQSCSLYFDKILKNNSVFRRHKNRTIVHDIKLAQCTQTSCVMYGVVVEDVMIDGLKTLNTFHTWGTAFKHVVFRGKIGEIMLTSNFFVILNPKRKRIEDAFTAVNTAYYENVDWALDISEASFYDCDIRGIPARLIRRDPVTEDVVLAAPKSDPNFNNLLDGLKMLRDAGVAEPD